MGILAEPLDYLRRLPLPQGFHVCELGDQWITQPERRLARDFYCNDLRCKRYESIDGNGRGTILADLNLPIKPWPGHFDLVTDFGTGEHIFNQYQVFVTIHNLMRVGAFFVFDRPTEGYPEHCYWHAQECLFRDVAEQNAYEIILLEKQSTLRGRLIRGVFRRTSPAKFRVPQQGRYKKLLRPIIDPELHAKAEKKRLRLERESKAAAK